MYDLLIIGGGVNGAGIARDAAGRGLKVLLCEKHDLGGATSSASSKLIHGGLRYLETYEFSMVRKSLAEREVLLGLAPHIVWPLRFVLPVDKGMRPSWMLRAGLFIYDHLAKRAILPATKTLNLRQCLQGAPLQDRLTKAFEYSDCWVDDARLVVLNAMDAEARGANVATRTECIALERSADHWTAQLRSNGETRTVKARIIVNAAGMWVDDVLQRMGERSNRGHIRLVKGSHIVTRKLFEGAHCYIFQTADGRVVFAMPYQGDYTLIGTTEEDWSANQGKPVISEGEIDYLCGVINGYFREGIGRQDIVWSFAGVRPLFDDKAESASVVTRDYVFDLDSGDGNAAPSLSIFGGKLTTYRKLAEDALEQLAPHIGNAPAWTAAAPLPGGDIGEHSFDKFVGQCTREYPWLPATQIERMAHCYGALLPGILGKAQRPEELGRDFGNGLYEAEVRHLIEREYAQTAEDVLWRRTKLGLVFDTPSTKALDEWMKIPALGRQTSDAF